MNFKRKLKLHNLNIYNFSKREMECLNIINALGFEKLSFEQIEFFYSLMNLNIVVFNDETTYFDNIWYFSDNDKNIYFKHNKHTKIFVGNFFLREKLHKLFNLQKIILMEEFKFISYIIINGYKINNFHILNNSCTWHNIHNSDIQSLFKNDEIKYKLYTINDLDKLK